MRWKRATAASRVIGAALAFDAKGTVVPDPEAPPEPEPGPDPEPEPPSPPTEGLEPPVAGATHVGLKVGPARQTVTAIGFGLGSPGGQSPAKTLEKHTKVLVNDPGANSIRLNGPSTAYVDSCKVLADAGIKLVHVTSYENNLTTNPVGSAKSFVGGVMQLLVQGGQGHQRVQPQRAELPALGRRQGACDPQGLPGGAGPPGPAEDRPGQPGVRQHRLLVATTAPVT